MSWTHERARVAALSRDRKPDDPELQGARQRLKAARLEDHVRKTVAAWPPLDQSQLDAIAVLLRPVPAVEAEAEAAGGGDVA
ncbi:hypothetical protein J2W14_002342 [Pseudarthrobacter oxydans]|uniref:hypothetical protein n=1 Tax=Pseudarthrobacter oxydans TaxID=1671 RepID=UPI002783A74C|nr:hypothetical protein [Pseudarthrobacter oxydans]MDP9982940.1 hypothetical protein [Pseudarthrobacter oxydans]